MKLNKLFAVGMAAMMTMSMAACGAATVDGQKSTTQAAAETTAAASEAASEASKESGAAVSGSIGLSVSTLNNPFFVTLEEGAEAKAKELGVELVSVDAGDDSAKQASDIEDLISKKVSVLIVNPVDSDAVAPAVKDAIAAGIKVIAVDRVVNGVEVDCSIASDNVAGAESATKFLTELVGKDAKVAELQGTPGASAAIDRGTGFHNIADTNLKVVSSQTGNFNRSEGMTVMENMLQADAEIKGVFAANDEMALGAIEAIGDKDIAVVGFDATDDALKSIQDGKMKATIAQQPDLMGATAVDTAAKLMNGEAVEKSIPVEVTLVSKDNVSSYIK
ncbi:D-ribose ABC transporter substrate-binding protein [[Clostridium] aminophilum]|uniref:Ribose-binding protein n=1 Tax=[Clostridium] aminophilum TaxID=1526 RepID=A0A1I6K995_9FIRM|nr:D-ribose ABC transporter substrate-binding protein [[Clostridium] aminophilum]MCR4629808.1 D-ribose ABC transporter substrate-binding protein [Clostridium sp.]SFR87776.1 ribose-binding protein [[Clostridium] aminophilum]